MIRNLFVLFGALMLVGCGDKSDIEALVKKRLKDPESAIFQDFVKSESGEYACISWNAKNGFGGYGEWSITRLRKAKGTWKILDAETRPDYCTEEAFIRRKEVDALHDKWEGKTLTQ